MNGRVSTIVVLVLIILCCCCLLAGGTAAGMSVFRYASQPQAEMGYATVVVDTVRGTPSAPPQPETTLAPHVQNLPATDGAYETLETLRQAIIPIRDPIDLAAQLQGKHNIPLTLETAPVQYQVGDAKQFWVTNVDTNRNFEVTARLRYLGTHHYFWIQEGINYIERDLQRLAETFDQHIYPTTREFFGSEWNPGVDNDPRIFILYARNVGARLAGYFSSSDSLHPLAHPYSNAHELFLLNADTIDLNEDFAYGVLAHEFQHMIHWNQDRNEEAWLNEGFSEMAVFLNSYYQGGFDRLYACRPDLQLNDWPNDSSATTPHYGASFLFVAYYLDRFGEDATKALVAHPLNGLDSIDAVLGEMGEIDPLSGQIITADDLFGDWALTNYLKERRVSDRRYDYAIYPDSPRVDISETHALCPADWQNRFVRQYGVHYISLHCPGSYNLQLSGASEVSLLPVDPYSGEYAFWSNKGDESNMTLTRSFDLRVAQAPLTLRYAAWFDIEADYDYVYVLASENGQDWDILITPSGTAENPSGNSYGWAYNGVSQGWLQEQVDLSAYAGKQIQVRFEYVTDAAINGEGFLVDDIAIPQIGYFEDFEADEGGWLGEGFVRVQNRLPQTFRVALIYKSEIPVVEQIVLDENRQASIWLDFSGDYDEVVLVVSGTTRYTRQRAAYSYRLLP